MRSGEELVLFQALFAVFDKAAFLEPTSLFSQKEIRKDISYPENRRKMLRM